MGKASADALVAAVRTALGWPYVSPGTNNANGIDCSGLLVYAYKQIGAGDIYHGSNTIARKYVRGLKTLDGDTSYLRCGMAVFKHSANGEPSRYQNDGLGNFQHIGIVAMSPAQDGSLQIIHATSVGNRCVVIDTKLGKWHSAAYLNAIDYDKEEGTMAIEVEEYQAKVVAETGKTVRMRKAPSTSSAVMVAIPLGEIVSVTEHENDTWARISYNGMNGYMMRKFLSAQGDVVELGEVEEAGDVEDEPVSRAEFDALKEQVQAMKERLGL